MRYLVILLGFTVIAQTPDWVQVKNKPTVTYSAIDNRFTRTNGNGASGDLSVAGPGKTITLTPCPRGIAGTYTRHYVYISSGTGTAEAVLITGGTCTSGKNTGTIIVTTANTHSGAWKVTSATGGISESVSPLVSSGGYVKVPAGTYTLYAPIWLPRRVSLEGEGYASILSYVPTTGVAIIHADGYDDFIYADMGGISKLTLTGPGDTTSTTAIWMGGDGTNVVCPSTWINSKMVYRDLRITNFGTAFVQGEHSWNHEFYNLLIHIVGVGFDVITNTGTSGSRDRWYGGGFFTVKTAAVRYSGGHAGISFYGTYFEWCKHALVVSAYGASVNYYGAQFETPGDTPAACTGTDYCGEFIVVNNTTTPSDVTIGIYGGAAYYNSATVNSTTMFNLTPQANMTLKVENLDVGWSRSGTPGSLTNIFTISALNGYYSDHVSASIGLTDYATLGDAAIVSPNTYMKKYWVKDKHGNMCFQCTTHASYAFQLGAGPRWDDTNKRIPLNLTEPTGAGTDYKVGMRIGSWLLMQDPAEVGTKDIGLYNITGGTTPLTVRVASDQIDLNGALGLKSVVFASLGSVPAAGIAKWCSNCVVAATCAGAGTGALAISNGTNWVCK